MTAAARVALVVFAAVAVLIAGCGSSSHSRQRTVVLALDFTPNAVHAPIFTAVRKRYDRAEGVHLVIRTPGSQPDSLKLLAAGRADIGILDIQDLAIARERGKDLVGVAALVQRPLAALVAQPAIHRPRDLAGRLVGVSGLPSDPAFLRAIVQHDGGDYGRVRQVTIGFNAIGSLLARRVAAVPAFWNVEGVTLRLRGLKVREFRADDYGAPRYPEVVLMTTRRTLRSRRDAIVRTLRAIRRGLENTVADPAPAVAQIARAAGSPRLDLIRAQLRAVAPALRPPLRLDRRALEAWARFDARIGIVKRAPDVARAFDFTLVR